MNFPVTFNIEKYVHISNQKDDNIEKSTSYASKSHFP